MSIFDKYIDEGISKADSFNRKMDKLKEIIIDLSESLKKIDVELDWFYVKNSRGIGYRTIISANGLNKNFFEVTIGSTDDDTYFLHYDGSIKISQSIDDLISNIGNIFSSSLFWRDIDKFRSIEY